MNYHIRPLSIFGFLLVCCFATLSQANGQTLHSFGFKERLKKPKYVYVIELNDEPGELKKFYAKLPRYHNLQKVIVSGAFSKASFELLMANLPRIKALNELEFDEVELPDTSLQLLPDSITALSHLSFFRCKNMPAIQLLMHFAGSRATLSSLEIIYSSQQASALPFSIFSRLKSLTCIEESAASLSSIFCAGLPVSYLEVQVPGLSGWEHCGAKLPNLQQAVLHSPGSFFSQTNQRICYKLSLQTEAGDYRIANVCCLFTTGSPALPQEAEIKQAFGAAAAYTIPLAQPEPVSEDRSEHELLLSQENLANEEWELASLQNQNATLVSRSEMPMPGSNFKSPLPAVNVAVATYQMQAHKPAVITTGSQSKIQIPANALTDMNGNPVKGAVEIYYREFRDPVDFMVSGVPMMVHDSGEMQPFQSAGMFEMRASQNGRPLKIAAGKTIQVNFAAENVPGGFNQYRMDSSHQTWQQISQPQSVMRNDSFNLKNDTSQPTAAYFNIDTTSFDGRFLNPNRIFLNDSCIKYEKFVNAFYNADCRKKKTDRKFCVHPLHKKQPRGLQVLLFWETNPTTLYVSGKKMMLALHVQPPLPTDTTRRVTFTISDNTNGLAFPELNKLNWRFAPSVQLSPKEFRAAYVSGYRYNDVRVEYEQGNSTCTIILKSVMGYKRIEADIAYGVAERLKPAYKRRFWRMYLHYQKILNQRRSAFQSDIAIRYREALAKQQADNRRLQGNTLGSAFALSGFAVYNCDQIASLKAPQRISISYSPEQVSGQSAEVTAYIIDKNVNGVLTFLSAAVGISTTSPTHICIAEKGRLYYIRHEDLVKFKTGGKFPATLQVLLKLAKDITNTSQLRQLLKF